MARPGLEHFERFCGSLVLDTGEGMRVEDFQRIMLGDFFAGCRETIVCIAKGSGKTTLLAALALFELLTDPNCEGAVCAASRDQAALLLGQLRGFVERTPGLAGRVQLKQREAVNRRTGGRFRVLAADEDTMDGLLLSFAVADELHRWRDSERYAILLAAVQKRDGHVFGISTAGVREEGLLWTMRERAIEMGAQRDGSYLVLRTPAFALHEWSLPEDGDPRDLALVNEANPAPWVTLELLRERFESPSRTDRDWERFTCNRWIDRSRLDAVISLAVWRELAGTHTPVAPACFAIDVAPDRSSAAIVAATFDGTGEERMLGVEVVEHGQGLAWLVERAVQLDARHDHVGFLLDGAGPVGTLIPRLEEYGIEYHAVTAREYSRACQGFFDLVSEGRLRHCDQPPLNLAVAAAGRRRLTDGWAWSRSNSLGDISPLVAASLATYGLTVRGPVSREAFDAIH